LLHVALTGENYKWLAQLHITEGVGPPTRAITLHALGMTMVL
jgi:hypothetical protein